MSKLAQKIALGLITLYQKTLSPDHGWFKGNYPLGYCRYKPTCSDYTYQAVAQYGVVKGMRLGFKRIGRCVPWRRGGTDPVPK